MQGTINGFGERCGNANLVSIIPNLMLKMGLDVHPAREPARAARRLALRLGAGQPQAVVVAALRRRLRLRPQGRHARLRGAEAPARPTSTSTRRRWATTAACSSPSWPGSPTSSGRPREYGIDLDKNTPDARRILEMLKRAGGRGLPVRGRGGLVRAPDGAGARQSPALLRARGLPGDRRGAERGDERAGGRGHRAAAREGHRGAHRGGRQRPGATRSTTRCARPWRTSTRTCRRCRLLDYKVRILDESKGTAAKTRVLITSGDGDETWGTVGVADNIIEASWQALVDSVEYKLRRDEKQGKR